MDIYYLFIWWLFFLVVGLINFPLTWFLFRKSFDLGYGFSKTIGLLIISYLAFIGASAKVFPLTQVALFGILLLTGVLGAFLAFKNESFLLSIKKNWKIILLQEIIFTLGLILWAIIRGYAPDIRGLEKFMDFGFINSILQGKYLPPIDMWFAGKELNYYWFGHFFAAVPIKITSIPPAVGYNLMLGTILGILATGAFSVIPTLVKTLSPTSSKKAISAGIISALMLVFAGNLHTPIYLIKNGFEKYWYPDATRFIGYFPETQDKTIHEFPIYSFVVSDLHAHLLDVPFTLLFWGILLSLVISRKNNVYRLLAGGITLGVMFATNTWDFASYGMAAGFIILFTNLFKKKGVLKSAVSVFLQVSAMALIGLLAFLPFLLNFSSIAQGIELVHSHSPLWQLGVLWGFPFIMTVVFLVLIKKIRGGIQTPDIFVLGTLTAAWILILIPELVFVKDIYIASHYRANTMFKLTYEAYVIFYLSAGYIAVRTVGAVKKVLKPFVAVAFALLFTSLLIYPFMAVNSYYGDLKNFQGLSGETWVNKFYPDSYKAILWLRENAVGQPVILEAPGNSYTDSNLISSYTGLPTIQGWFVHEWLWRGSPALPQERVDDATIIYQTTNASQASVLLKKYNVSYVLIGSFERERFPNLDEAKFLKLGKRVFAAGKTSIYRINN